MKRIFLITLFAITLMIPVNSHSQQLDKYTQLTDTITKADGIRSGMILHTMHGEMYKSLCSYYSLEKDLNGPLATVLKKGNKYILNISGISKPIYCKKILD